MREPAVIDASALVELLAKGPRRRRVDAAVRPYDLHAPGHVEAEVLNAIGRLARAGDVTDQAARAALAWGLALPYQRHPLGPLVLGAWDRRHNLRLVDALYVELASQLDAPLVTCDAGQAVAYGHAVLVT